MTREERVAALRQKLDKSRMLGDGMTERCRAIEAEIARLEQER